MKERSESGRLGGRRKCPSWGTASRGIGAPSKLIRCYSLLVIFFLVGSFALPCFSDARESSPQAGVQAAEGNLGTGLRSEADRGHIAILPMDMMVLPGTQSFLEAASARAVAQGARAIVVQFDTPGGILTTTQEMVQFIFQSPVPIVIYVAPTGAAAISAGVFLTMAGHVAAMAPGTSIGAAHPVQGDGKDIEGDMRAKVENMAVALVKSISEQRGRNVEWVEAAVKESSSLTEKEALDQNVIDLIAEDMSSLLRGIAGRTVEVQGAPVTLPDYSELPRITYPISTRDRMINVLANPNIAALLWLGATTGISVELYNPGAILPGVVGVICLILALAVSQVIPISQGAVALMVIGALLIGAEIYVASGILGVGGIIAMALGALYLVDTQAAPGMSVSPEVVLPLVLVAGGLMLWIVRTGIAVFQNRPSTGEEGMEGSIGSALENFTEQGKIRVRGEIWRATCESGVVTKGEKVEVIAVEDGLRVKVRKIS